AFQSAAAASFGAESRSPSLLVSSLFNPVPTAFGFADELFVGTATGILALLALADATLRRRAAFLWLLAVLTFLLSLGTRTPLFYWYYRLQGSGVRLPQRLVLATGLVLALLSALGGEAFRRTRQARGIFALLCGLGALLLWSLARTAQDYPWFGT